MTDYEREPNIFAVKFKRNREARLKKRLLNLIAPSLNEWSCSRQQPIQRRGEAIPLDGLESK